MKISVVIPSLNQARFLERAIDSVLEQEGPFQLIVIDGGSTDGTADILDAFRPFIDVLVSEPDEGQSDAINKGFAHADGELLCWLCADDFYLPGAFARVRHFFREHPGAAFVYGDGWRVDREGRSQAPIISDPCPGFQAMVNYNYVFSTSAFWSRDLWMRAGGRVDDGNHWTMDWELFLRMSRHAELHHIDAKLACLRCYEETKTASGMVSMKRRRDHEIVSVSRRHGGVLCYNSIVHPLVRFGGMAVVSDGWPRPLRSLFFRICHLPIVIFPRLRDSMLTGRRRPPPKY